MAQIFISYARADVAVAKLVKTGLAAAGYTSTLDIDDFTRGDWAWQITTKIQAASDVLVFVGPASLASENVAAEVRQALEFGKPLVPVLLSDPAGPKPEWAVQLLRNQAARYDALDLDVSLARIKRLLSCQPAAADDGARAEAAGAADDRADQRPAVAPAASRPAPVPAPVASADPTAAAPSASPHGGSSRWIWGAAAVVAVGAVVAWLAVSRPEPQAISVAPTPVAPPSLAPGKVQISFKGAIKREQIEALEGRLRAQGFEVARSERTEAITASQVGHLDERSAALAGRVRLLAQQHFDVLGCRLSGAIAVQPLPAARDRAPADLTLSVVGSCP